MKKSRVKSITAAFCLTTLLATSQIREYDLNFFTPGAGGYPTEFEAQHLAKTGNFYLMGGSKNFGTPTSPVQDPVIVKLNSDGTLAGLNKRYQITGTQHSTHITAIESNTISNAGYLLSGITDISAPFTSNFLIKTNLTGAVIWKKNFTFTNSYGNNIALRIKQVIQASNGSVFIVGILHDGNLTSAGTEMTIIRMDPVTGTIDWYKTYQHPSGSSQEGLTPIGIIEGPAGKFIIHGRTKQNSPSSSFIFSFQDSPTHGPALANLKMVGLSHPSSPVVNSTIESIHFYQGNYIVGGQSNKIISSTGYDQVYLFRLDNNLSNPKSMDGFTNKTSSYLQSQNPELTHITSNASGLILSGSASGTLPYSSFVMLVGTNGSVINSRKGTANVETSNTSVNCFAETSGGFASLYHRTDGTKNSRFTKYSSIGFTCQDASLPSSNPFNDNITIIEQPPLAVTRLMQTSSPVVTVADFPVSVTNICEGCATTPTPGPITTSTGGTVFCTTPFTLYAPAGFSNYIWTLDGNAFGTGSSVNITTGGVYTVYMLDENGCEAVQTITITDYSGCIIENTPPNITYCSLLPASIPTIGWNTNPLSDCNGKWSYNWYYNGDPVAGGSYTTSFQGPGTYSVVATTPCGSQTFVITVTDLLIEYINHPSAQPNLTSMIPGPTFGPLYTPGPGLTYSWIVNNLTTSVQQTGTSGSIVVSPYTTGDILEVTLILTDLSRCETYRNTITWSDNLQRKAVAQLPDSKDNVMHETGFRISPNPASDHVTISIDDFKPEEKYLLTIYSANGSQISNIQLVKSTQLIDISNIKNGLYVIELHKGEQVYRSRLVINK